MNLSKGINLFIPLFFCFLLQSCCWFKKCDCENFDSRPDIQIPDYLPQQVTFAEGRPVWVGTSFYPYGTYIFTSGINEFYSIQRYDPNYGVVVFYWNQLTPPSPALFLYTGEEITIFKWIFNKDINSGSCKSSEAGESNTEITYQVKVEGGKVVEEKKIDSKTPSIPPGQVSVAKGSVLFNIPGTYKFTFRGNSKRTVAERDTTNNEFISREEKNIGNVANRYYEPRSIEVALKPNYLKDTIINQKRYFFTPTALGN